MGGVTANECVALWRVLLSEAFERNHYFFVQKNTTSTKYRILQTVSVWHTQLLYYILLIVCGVRHCTMLLYTVYCILHTVIACELVRLYIIL